jgi:hypothetical protein
VTASQKPAGPLDPIPIRDTGVFAHEHAVHHHLHPDRRGAALATASLLPIVRTFAKAAGIDVQTSDISVAAASWGSSRA